MDASTCDCEPAVTTARTVRLDSREVVALAASWRALARVFLPQYQVVAPALAPDTVRAAQRRIDQLVDACGCGEGAGMTIVAVVAYLAYAASAGSWPGTVGVMWRCLAAMFMGASVGKLGGLARARVELRRVLLELAPSLPSTPVAPPVNETADDVFAAVFVR